MLIFLIACLPVGDSVEDDDDNDCDDDDIDDAVVDCDDDDDNNNASNNFIETVGRVVTDGVAVVVEYKMGVLNETD